MKNAGKACNNRLYRHIRTFEKIVKNYFVIYTKKDTKPRVKALAPTSVYANADACYSASLCMVSHLYMSIFPIIDISGPSCSIQSACTPDHDVHIRKPEINHSS